jgi:hypothetical protein
MRKVIGAIVALIIIVGLVWLLHKPSSSPAAPTTIDAPQAQTLAWNTFDSYVAALKSHDLPALSAISYQLSDTCKDPEQKNDCYAKMDSVYAILKDFKPSEFTHVAFDDKQIITSSNWKVEKTDLAYGKARKVIYLTRKPDGTAQLLSVTLPEEIVYTLVDKKDTSATLEKELLPRLQDTDGDMLADEVENCSYPNAPKTCVKTDPNLKDTNGNGWWDSIETWFYPSTSVGTSTPNNEH